MEFFRARRYHDAIKQARKTLELEPAFSNALWCLGKSMIQQGALDDARTLLQKAVQYSPENAIFKADLALVYGKLNVRAEALRIHSGLKSAQSEGYVSPYALALASLALDDREQTLQYLSDAYDQKDPHLIWLNEEVYFDPLRSDIGFDKIVKKMRFYPREK